MLKSSLNGQAYDAMALSYQDYRGSLRTHGFVARFERGLPRQAAVLDVGCGSGDPVDIQLTARGHLVTGIDISTRQISLARKNCPNGNFIVKDMLELKQGDFLVDAVVSMYALFHVPRVRHGILLSLLASYLPQGGRILLSMGDRDFEGYHELCGQKVWSSHYGADKNIDLVQKAGFILDEVLIDTSGDEKHQILFAHKG